MKLKPSDQKLSMVYLLIAAVFSQSCAFRYQGDGTFIQRASEKNRWKKYWLYLDLIPTGAECSKSYDIGALPPVEFSIGFFSEDVPARVVDGMTKGAGFTLLLIDKNSNETVLREKGSLANGDWNCLIIRDYLPDGTPMHAALVRNQPTLVI